jgi:hypothetical protein
MPDDVFGHKDDPLVEAARYNDAEAADRGFIDAIVATGINVDAFMHIVDQRALRIALLLSRGPTAVLGLPRDRPVVVSPTPRERALVEQAKLALIDGIMIGWKGRAIYGRSHGPNT